MNELNLNDKVAVITGGAGIICSTLAHALSGHGVRTVILDHDIEAARRVAKTITEESGVPSLGVYANVLDRHSVEEALQTIHERFNIVDILVNGAGGNSSAATTKIEIMDGSGQENFDETFFGLNIEGFDKAFELNFKGTLIPTLVFARDMVSRRSGVIVNISSMNSFRPLTRIPAYSAAKAAVNNFTQWLAVHFSKTGVRVNAIAPGFLLTKQNKYLLTDENSGDLTPRGKKIIDSTPMGRYCVPEELSGTLIYLVSDMSKFVTGVVVPVDGGFSAYSGV